MTAETLPRAMYSTAVDVATDTQADIVITPGNEAYAVVEISEDSGDTYTEATMPRLYRSEVTETLEGLENDTLVRVRYYGGCGKLDVDITASTP